VRGAAAALVLLLAAPARGAEEAPAPAPAAPAPASPSGKPAAGTGAAEKPAWRTDPVAARREAREKGTRVLAVVLAGFYESEPCTRLEKALEEEPARAALEGLVPLRVVEKEDLAFSKAAGLEDLGHPYTALVDPEGKAIAWRRGALPAKEWAREVRALVEAAAAFEAKRAAAEKDPADARALWELSESLRPLGRVREADEALGRAERADPSDRAGLAPLFAFRRLEARLEDLASAQDFAAARALCDDYDREHPGSPRRPRVAFWRAVCRAHLGEAEAAKKDLEALASEAPEEELRTLARERAEAIGRILEKRGAK
jgi:tetratricopeptide (TPR) repeat protein